MLSVDGLWNACWQAPSLAPVPCSFDAAQGLALAEDIAATSIRPATTSRWSMATPSSRPTSSMEPPNGTSWKKCRRGNCHRTR